MRYHGGKKRGWLCESSGRERFKGRSKQRSPTTFCAALLHIPALNTSHTPSLTHAHFALSSSPLVYIIGNILPITMKPKHVAAAISFSVLNHRRMNVKENKYVACRSAGEEPC